MNFYKNESERYQSSERLERKRYEDLYLVYMEDTYELKYKIVEYETQYNANLNIQIENKRKKELTKLSMHCNYR